MDETALKHCVCSRCKQRPDRVLLLICLHHLCVPCAGGQLNIASGAIVCRICLQSTELERSSVLELLKYIPENPGSELRSVQDDFRSLLFSTRSEGGVRERCRDHPEEEVNYYCFDCESGCICSECVTRGAHQGHQVKSIRRTYPLLKGKVDNMLLSLAAKVEDLQTLDHRLENNAKELETQSENVNRQIAESFQELHLLLDKKHRQLTDETNETLEEHFIQIQYYRKILKKRLDWFQDLGEALHSVLSRNSQSEIIDFYSSHVESILSEQELENAEMQQIEHLGKLTYVLDISSAALHIGSLKSLRLQIEDLSLPSQQPTPTPEEVNIVSPLYKRKRRELRAIMRKRAIDDSAPVSVHSSIVV